MFIGVSPRIWPWVTATPGSLLSLVPVGDDVAEGLVVDVSCQVHGCQGKHLLHLGAAPLPGKPSQGGLGLEFVT